MDIIGQGFRYRAYMDLKVNVSNVTSVPVNRLFVGTDDDGAEHLCIADDYNGYLSISKITMRQESEHYKILKVQIEEKEVDILKKLNIQPLPTPEKRKKRCDIL